MPRQKGGVVVKKTGKKFQRHSGPKCPDINKGAKKKKSEVKTRNTKRRGRRKSPKGGATRIRKERGKGTKKTGKKKAGSWGSEGNLNGTTLMGEKAQEEKNSQGSTGHEKRVKGKKRKK